MRYAVRGMGCEVRAMSAGNCQEVEVGAGWSGGGRTWAPLSSQPPSSAPMACAGSTATSVPWAGSAHAVKSAECP